MHPHSLSLHHQLCRTEKNETKLSLSLNERLCGKFCFSETRQLFIKAKKGSESPLNGPKWDEAIVFSY